MALAAAPRGGVWTLASLVFGHTSAAAARRRLGADDPASIGPDTSTAPPDAVAEWVDLLERYAAGEPLSLEAIPVCRDHLTPFGKFVSRSCAAIPYGQTRSYGQLAKQAGRPAAARAVGSVMSGNRTPLAVPCHRVLGAGGRLGGFSAPQGVAMKRRLLEMEGSWMF
ncbi:methylated-DNA--[protein]-cysteine S-methyltransferase [Posidoniimonas corsicana]|nr:methylated-DNA--[protein]-cysteine S-methyltransferase [Posidoniimonas corsicana]